MLNRKALIFGNSNISTRIINYLKDNNIDFLNINDEEDVKTGNLKAFDNIDNLKNSNFDYIFIVSDSDDRNIEFLLITNELDAKSKIAIVIFNDNLAKHLKNINKNLNIFNPGEISSGVFVSALEEEVKLKFNTENYIKENNSNIKDYSLVKLIFKLFSIFLIITILSTTFFHFSEKLSWIDSLYFVVVTFSTVGYGDINLLQSGLFTKIFLITFILVSFMFVWYGFSILINDVIKRREDIKLGIKKYRLKNHIILCGLGRIGYFVAEKLIEKGEKVLIIENDKDSRYIDYVRKMGVSVYVGDASMSKTLQNANVVNAKALFTIINDDSKNIEIGLNARSINPQIKLILRIYNKEVSEKIKDVFDIHLTYSVSEITAKNIINTIFL